MAGVMAISRDKMLSEINSINYLAAGDVAAKLDQLRRFRREFINSGSELALELLSPVLNLLSDSSSPVRKYITRMIGEIGQKHLELLPEIIPVLIDVLKDETPAVCRQAILCATAIFRTCFIKVVIQGLYASEISETLKRSWEAVLKLKDELYTIAFGVGNEGIRICALKFVESVVLLYTPDPDGSLEPMSQENLNDIDISWLRGGHPLLNVSDLSGEASQNLSQMLDLLRAPYLKFNNFLMIIVLIKSISILAKKRPAFYGRILPVLLAFKPSISASKVVHVAGVHQALKNAFESCLDCVHDAAAPWRNRLLSALSVMKVGDFLENPSTVIVGTNDTAAQGDDTHSAQDKKSSPLLFPEHDNVGRKRIEYADRPEFIEDGMAAKRARSSLSPSEELRHGMTEELERNSPSEKSASQSTEDNGPVQQLVAMFGALVAQGEKAVASLEILIASISADLLAEVVMANMQNIPPKSFKSEGNETSLQGMGDDVDVTQCDMHIKHLSVLLADVLPQSVSIEKDSVIENSPDSFPAEFEQAHGNDELEVTLTDSNAEFSSLNEQVAAPLSEYASVGDVLDFMDTGHVYTSDKANDTEDIPDVIPGLVLSVQNEEVSELASSNSFAGLDDSNLTDLVEGSQEDNPPLGGKPVENYLLTSDMSEELHSKAMDSTSVKLSATSDLSVSRVILPKISAPVLYLSDEQKDQLQQLAFVHIIDAYRQVSVAGGSEARFSILAHSGMEFPTELDPWKLLREHIFSDYSNHEGHELTLRALYRLYGEAEADRDFFASTTATSVYETFLLQVTETLRDSFPASDKSLGRILCDVPYLPKSIFEMLETLSCPSNDEMEMYGGDRVTQGLSVVWSLILQRPPIRGSCLKIALKSAVHYLEEVRMKAIRLIANKLYPMPSISGEIEEFATEKMVSCISEIGHPAEADKIHKELPESRGSAVKDISPDSHQLSASDSTPSFTLAAVQQYMSLYFALCTKRHSLFWKVFNVYRDTSAVAKQAIHQQIPLLVRTIGSSPDLLNILSDPPLGSEGLIIQVVQTLTDGIIPSPELVLTIKKLYENKLKDVDILIPILPFLSKDEVLALFPHLVSSPLDKFQLALSRVVEGFNQSSALLAPAEALISIHEIDPERDGIPLKKVTDACNACFEQRHVFSQQVLAKVLNQLVEQIPLPLLFMRTVLQAVGAFPSLVDFIMEILSRLVNKQIWKYPKLWVGFLKCTQLTKPQSFRVLLQLPTAQLENALTRIAAIKEPLVAHASQPHIRSSLPRSSLVVLGLETHVTTEATPNETQTESENQIQTQTQTPATEDPENQPEPEPVPVAENSQESSPGS